MSSSSAGTTAATDRSSQLHHFAGGATKILDHTDAAQIDRDEDAAAAAGMLGHG
jgi:hypothetical protein